MEQKSDPARWNRGIAQKLHEVSKSQSGCSMSGCTTSGRSRGRGSSHCRQRPPLMRSQRIVAPHLNEAPRSARHTHAMETGPVVWPPHRALAKSKRDCTRERDRAMLAALAITTATPSRAGARPGVAASSREPARPRFNRPTAAALHPATARTRGTLVSW